MSTEVSNCKHRRSLILVLQGVRSESRLSSGRADLVRSRSMWRGHVRQGHRWRLRLRVSVPHGPRCPRGNRFMFSIIRIEAEGRGEDKFAGKKYSVTRPKGFVELEWLAFYFGEGGGIMCAICLDGCSRSATCWVSPLGCNVRLRCKVRGVRGWHHKGRCGSTLKGRDTGQPEVGTLLGVMRRSADGFQADFTRL